MLVFGIKIINHFATGAEMYRHRLWRFQLTLAVVCTGKRRLSFFLLRPEALQSQLRQAQ